MHLAFHGTDRQDMVSITFQQHTLWASIPTHIQQMWIGTHMEV